MVAIADLACQLGVEPRLVIDQALRLTAGSQEDSVVESYLPDVLALPDGRRYRNALLTPEAARSITRSLLT